MDAARALLRRLFDAAVRAASAEFCLGGEIARLPNRPLKLIGAGKAAAAMAAAVEAERDVSGFVVVPYGHALRCRSVAVMEAGHPLPDENGLAATERMLELAADFAADDHVVCLLSGGGSALLTRPADGLSLADKQAVTQALLNAGAPIRDINAVRQRLSAVKGGRLAAACLPARVTTLIISDVPGDDPRLVASGPTARPEKRDVRAILDRWSIDVPESVSRLLAAPPAPLPEFDPDLRIVATSNDAQQAAAVASGLTAAILGDLEGDARELAGRHAQLALQVAAGNGPVKPPCVLISGGESTVRVRGSGRGGRNSEYALALAQALDGHPRISALAADTDGLDGRGGHAGAFVLPDTLARGGDPLAALADNDSYAYFDAIGDLLVTGPTRTNVNDLRAILIAE